MDKKDIKSDSVFDYLYNAIKKGEIASGQTLTERDLADKLGVSRTPIREALRRLEKHGLVKPKPHKGVKVISLTEKEIKQLYQVREVLEGLGARLLAQQEDSEAVERLASLLSDAEKAVHEKDIDNLSKINTRFHSEIAIGSGNIYLHDIMQTLQSHISLVMSTSLNRIGRPLENIDEHRLIIDAIRRGDPDLAESIAKYHVRNAMENALTVFHSGKGAEVDE